MRAACECVGVTCLTALSQGVKKLGVSLELSYTNIRKYLLSYLNSSIQSLLFHLGDVLGMSRWSDRFGVLGLSETAVQGEGVIVLVIVPI